MKDDLTCLSPDGNWAPGLQLRNGEEEYGYLVPRGELG